MILSVIARRLPFPCTFLRLFIPYKIGSLPHLLPYGRLPTFTQGAFGVFRKTGRDRVRLLRLEKQQVFFRPGICKKHSPRYIFAPSGRTGACSRRAGYCLSFRHGSSAFSRFACHAGYAPFGGPDVSCRSADDSALANTLPVILPADTDRAKKRRSISSCKITPPSPLRANLARNSHPYRSLAIFFSLCSRLLRFSRSALFPALPQYLFDTRWLRSLFLQLFQTLERCFRMFSDFFRNRNTRRETERPCLVLLFRLVLLLLMPLLPESARPALRRLRSASWYLAPAASTARIASVPPFSLLFPRRCESFPIWAAL